MRDCQFCDGPLDMDGNGLAWSASITVFDPFYAAHDVCAEAARGRQRDLSLHRLYCHLPNCFWQPKAWDAWQPTKAIIEVADRTSSDRWNDAWKR